jgi:hypothetical protein
MIRSLLALAVAFFLFSPAFAADWYIDPQHGDPENDGTAKRPWQSLQAVVDRGLIETRTWNELPHNADRRLVPKNAGAPIKAGDTIWLRSGDYGDVSIRGHYNADFITLAAEEGHTPRVRSVLLQSGGHWALKGLHVSPEFGTADTDKPPRTLVDLASHGWRGPIRDVVVEDCVIRSAEDTSDWSADDWNRRAASGIDADGTRMIIRRNRLKNVNFGISVAASHSLVEKNVIENFAGDGLRGLGDHSVFQQNLVKNCYDVNANHDDGFQSWTRGPEGVGRGDVVGIVLRGNTIINYEDPNQPHRGTLQGIGCFDGTFVDWVIENNVVIVDHWHGITLLGARGCRIVNNTVIDQNRQRPGPPWIRIGKHKDGTPPADCTIRNNLAASAGAAEGRGMVVDHNVEITDPAAFFAEPARRDLRLKDGSPAIDAGTDQLAPEVDIRGLKRPQGKAVDAGAYEHPAE